MPLTRGFAAPATLAALHLVLYLVLQMRPGVTGTVLWYFGPSLLGVFALFLLLAALVTAIHHRVTWNWQRAVWLAILGGLAVGPAFYRTYPSSHDNRPSDVRFVLPLAGRVTVAWGGEASTVNAHVTAPDQRWGYDLIVTIDGKSFRGSGRELADYLAYGREVFAPADGTVHTVYDGEPDVAIGHKGRGDDLGNHVAIQVAPREFLYIAHLQPGSIAVRLGERVEAGQLLGRVGNSGVSSEPHVHLHLQDSGRRHLAEGIPLHFHDYCHASTFIGRGMPTGGGADGEWTGQVVAQAVEGRCSAARTPHRPRTSEN